MLVYISLLQNVFDHGTLTEEEGYVPMTSLYRCLS